MIGAPHIPCHVVRAGHCRTARAAHGLPHRGIAGSVGGVRGAHPRPHRRAVVRALRQFGAAPTRELVDDLVQDAYVKLYADDLSALRRFRGGRPEALVAYLRAVAVNATRDHLRSAGADKRGARHVEMPGDDVLAGTADPQHTEHATERAVLIDQIDRWLLSNTNDTSGGRDRWIFWLYYRYGLTARAISDIPAVGLSQKGVESTIHRLTRLVRSMVDVPALAREGNDTANASR